MKPILKHISLLIFSGLILPVCSNCISVKTIARIVVPKQVTAIIKQRPDIAHGTFSFYHDIAEKALPILKSLN